MPIDPVTGALVATIGGNLINAGSTAAANRATRKWNEKMYDRQRADSLADWTMQNEYNSPTSQMARLREAGLNPNLVYGKGADNTSQAVRSSNTGSFKSQPAQVDVPRIGEFADFKMKQATIDNLKVQNTVLAQEAILKAATTGETVARTARSQFDLSMAQSLKQNSLEMAAGNLRKLQADTDFTIHSDERATLLNANSISQGVANVLRMRAETANTIAERRAIEEKIKGLQYDNRIKALDAKIAETGARPSDNIMVRAASRILGKIDGVGDFKKGGKFSWDEVTGLTTDSLIRGRHGYERIKK